MIEFFEKHFAKEEDNLETCDMDLDPTFEEKEKIPVLEVTEEVILINPLVRFTSIIQIPVNIVQKDVYSNKLITCFSLYR